MAPFSTLCAIAGSMTPSLALLIALSLLPYTLAVSGSFADTPACCKVVSTIVPPIAILVDLGMPAVLLTIAFYTLRARKKAAGAKEAELTSVGGTAGPRNVVRVEVDELAQLALEASEKSTPKPSFTQKLMKLNVLQSLRKGPGNAKRAREQSARLLEEALYNYATMPNDQLIEVFSTSTTAGLTSDDVRERQIRYGPNRLRETKPKSILSIVVMSIFQPFNALMAAVAILTISPPNSDPKTFSILMVLLVIAVVMRFVEEVKSSRLSRTMIADVVSHAVVMRDGVFTQISMQTVVPGDIVQLSTGQLVPGDCRLLTSRDLSVTESRLTGEATAVEKRADLPTLDKGVLQHDNIVLASTQVVSGTAVVIVLSTGDATFVGSMAEGVGSAKAPTSFERSVGQVVLLFIVFIAVMVPIVIVVNATSTGHWHDALAFGLSVAVGLTPQMMPMILTANLVKGARLLRDKKCLVRNLSAVQNLGAMDILCCDKTGTLTEDNVTLLNHQDVEGRESEEVLKLAYLNCHFQSGQPNLIDLGVLEKSKKSFVQADVEAEWGMVDEIPFDFNRRRMSVIVKKIPGDDTSQLLVCKGAFEELLGQCTHVRLPGGGMKVLDEQLSLDLHAEATKFSAKGLRVLGVATRSIDSPQLKFVSFDEAGMVFQGYLTFLDPPKLSAMPALKDLCSKGITIKVVTGDSLDTAKRVCADLGLCVDLCVSGAELADADKAELERLVSRGSVFAKVTPLQKYTIVTTLQKLKHVVGFLGDGTNDAMGLRGADVGISVSSGTDVAKEAADLVMTEKDLTVLAAGVIAGRTTYGNTIKYIKFASSSSFGNTFSILAAAVWLPFNPIAPVQVLVLNLLYNISQLAIPWDTMDPSFLEKPKRWNANFLGLYMLIVGPMSSVFDICTFLVLWYYFGANNGDDPDKAIFFETGWFIESLFTQTFIVHLLRTERIPFIQSNAAWPLFVSTFGTMAIGVALCYIPALSDAFKLTQINPIFYLYLIGIMFGYCCLIQLLKKVYIRIFKTWL